MDCASAEQRANDFYFAMPVPPSVLPWHCLSHFASALFPASPALFLLCLPFSLPLFAGAICRAAPAPSLALRQGECRRNEEGSTNQARGKVPAQCEIERRGRERNSASDARKRVQADVQTKHGLSKVCSRENWSTPHLEKFEYQYSNNTKCCRFNTSRIK